MSPRKRPAPTDRPSSDTNNYANCTASQQVNWYTVHEHVAPFLELVGHWPMVGTPEWCALPEGPVKAAALYDGARHWALRLELNQEALKQASCAINNAADWPNFAQGLQSSGACIKRVSQ